MNPAMPTDARLRRSTFLMSPPHFMSADEPNNVWMDKLTAPERRIDHEKATEQFQHLYEFLAARGMVYLLPSRPGLQDQVYTANLGIALPHLTDGTIVVSNFASGPRRGETAAGIEFFQQFSVPYVVAPQYFEGEADLKYLGEGVYIGAHGLRTSREALDWFERRFDMRVIPFEMKDEHLYHLDCAVFPITRNEVLVCTEVADPATLKEIEKHASIIDVSLSDAKYGITNCVRVGDFVLCASLEVLKNDAELYRGEVAKRESMEKICHALNLTPVYFDLSEYLKSGALLSCLVMHLGYDA